MYRGTYPEIRNFLDSLYCSRLASDARDNVKDQKPRLESALHWLRQIPDDCITKSDIVQIKSESRFGDEPIHI